MNIWVTCLNTEMRLKNTVSPCQQLVTFNTIHADINITPSHGHTQSSRMTWHDISHTNNMELHKTISDLPYPLLWVRHQWPPLPELSLRSQPSLPATRSIRLSTTIHSLLVRCTFTLSLLITWVLILFKIVKWGCSVHCIVCSLQVFIVYL